MQLNAYPLPSEIEEGPDRDGLQTECADLTSLYVKEAPRLLRYFQWATRGHHDAEDLTQQAFLQFSGVTREQGGKIAGPAAYLSRIARNLLKDRARIAVRRVPERHIAIDDLAAIGVDPVQTLEARDMLVRLQQAIGSMNPRTRAIFLAHRIEGLSYREIADRTGLSIKGVEKQMTKAIAIIHRAAGTVRA